MRTKNYLLRYRIPQGYDVEVIGFLRREDALEEKAKLEKRFGEVRLEEYPADLRPEEVGLNEGQD